MPELSSSQKGAAAEAEIAAAAIRANLTVLRPLGDGGRYDLAIDLGTRILRVQCKWATRQGDVIMTRCITSRRKPGGYLKTTYSAHEVDAIGVYCPDTDRCYLIPIELADGRTTMSLRVAPTRNRQAVNVRWASAHELETSLRRYWGTQSDEESIAHGALQAI
jgi:hypothetical protein